MSLTSWLASLRTRCTGFTASAFRRDRADHARRAESISPLAQQVEPLETRCLLSVSALLINGTLNVTASGADNITVRGNSTTGKVEVLDQNGLVKGAPTVNASALTGLVITGSDSDNIIDLSGVTAAQFSALASIVVNAGDGNDRLTGSPDLANSLTGGDGADTLTGGSVNDTLNGGNGADSIFGGLGNDSLLGGDGADTITGDDGNDTIIAGNGADSVDAGNGADSVEGNNGEDSLVGGLGDDTINGDGGTDTISGGDGNDVIYGGEFNDNISGDLGNDTIDAQAGDDTVDGGAGNDSLLGGTGNDSLLGNVGNDTLNGQADNDTLSGDDGNDSLFGGSGNDSMNGAAGDDTLNGQAGDDTLLGGGGADNLNGGDGNDLVSSFSQTVVVPDISIGDVMVTEGSLGAPSVSLTIMLSQATTVPVSVQVTTSNNIAEAGIDFTAINTVFTIPSGQTTATFGIPILADTIYEANETFFVNLSSAVGGTIVDSQATVTLTNDDAQAATQVVFLDFNSQTGGNDHVYNLAEQTDVLGRLQAIYAAFPVRFTTIAPASGPFTTVVINQTRGGPGLADEIDFRNLNYTSLATVDISGLLGGGGAPPATSANIVELTAKIVAHELGHTVGLRHDDSFGPIGSGISSNVNPAGFTPPYPGPQNATESTRHIMGSPLSTGETLLDAISGQFFGEREAVKLSTWAFGGSVNPEQAGAHGTLATAQPIQLQELFVPNTLVSGSNLGRTFRVHEMTVTGAIDVGGQRDLYTFQGAAGQLLNFEVISSVVAPPNSNPGHFANTIDSVIRVLDSSGNVIPYYSGTAQNNNGTDSGSPDTDSILIDLALPTTGTYFVEVSAATAADTGNYELYGFDFAIYTPATGNGSGTGSTTDTGDTLTGGAGDDTLFGADGNDVVNGGAGNDSINGGEGNDTIFGGAGADTLNGDAGDDSLDGQGGADVVEGGAGDDQLVWSGAGSGKDTLSNSTGFDTVVVNGSGASNSFVVGKTATNQLSVTESGVTLIVQPNITNVVINGNNGDDTITVGSLTGVVASVLTINGGVGDDVISAAGVSIGDVRMLLSGGVGNDSLTGSNSNDTLDGGDGSDTLLGGLGNDSMFGGAGVDRMNGEAGDDSLDGGDDNDALRGGDGNDSISGGNGDDSVLAGNGNDSVSGDFGADTIGGEAGNDVLNGDSGTDSLSGGDGADTINGGSEADSITGDAGNDSVFGNDGNDTIDGGDGNDTVIAGDGNDSVSGGLGDDAINGGDGNDTLNGGAGKDVLVGSDGNDLMLGGADVDTLLGGDGNDTLNGQGSTDILAGNEGTDTFNDASAIIDEQFALSATLMTALGG